MKRHLKILFSLFFLLSSVIILIDVPAHAVQTPKEDIINQIYPINHRDYSTIHFRINPNVKASNITEQLEILKQSKRTDIYLNVSSEESLANQLQKVLDSAKYSKFPILVYVPKGNYPIKHALHIYSNTWLRLDPETTMIHALAEAYPFIVNGESKASYFGYGGQSNIIIDGGVWNDNADVLGMGSTTFNIGHGQNIIIQNLTIKNVFNGHAIDLAGDKNVIIRDNQFLGFKDGDGTHGYVEAIQIDGFISSKSFPSFGSVDYTLSTNVIIEHNIFGNSNSKGMKPWAVGIGSHSALYEKAFSSIYINDNTFNGMTLAGIRTRHWSDISIYRNTFNQTSRGIWLDVTKESVDMKGHVRIEKLKMNNFLIKDNLFKGTKGLAIDTDGSNSNYITNLKTSNNMIIK